MSASLNLPAVMGTYGRFPMELVRGRGSEVWDSQGKRYLDFLSGISVCALGHCPETVAKALHQQIDTLWHVSNLYEIGPQKALAQLLVDHSFADQVFFCNSGTEAVEAALKLARIASEKISGNKRPVFVAMKASFHGRSLGSLSVTGQDGYQAPFRPLLPEVRFADFGSLDSLAPLLDDQVAAVILEPMQAEGGLNCPAEGYLQAVKDLCQKNGSLLIFDEVQTGIGRCGFLFAHEKYGVSPDIMSLAKGLGGGFPIGAMLATGATSQHFIPGTHASTFGGNPLACTAALAVMKEILAEGFLASVQSKAEKMKGALKQILNDVTGVVETRGLGLLQGLKLSSPALPIVKDLHAKGVLTGVAGAEVLRLAPPLNISNDLLDEGLDMIAASVKELLS